MMNRSRFGLAGVAAALALICGGCGKDEKVAGKASPPPPEVRELESEMRGAGIETAAGKPSEGPASPAPPLSVTGELASPFSSDLVPRGPGRVEAVLADVGDVVRKGQPLLRLETQYQRLELQRAQAEVARARAARDEAESDFRRKEELLRRNSIPQAVHDRSAGMVGQARAALAAAEAGAGLARQRLDDAIVRSPMDGVVAERRVDPGERLSESSIAYVLMTVQPLKLRFELPERYIPGVRAGQEIRVRVDAYPDEAFAGRVTRIGKVVSAQSRAFVVEADLANRDRRLRPGMFARVDLPGISAAPGGPAVRTPAVVGAEARR